MTAGDRPDAFSALVEDLRRGGLLVEAGWTELRMLAVPDDVPDDQVAALRVAFFCGAQHLFAAVMDLMGDTDRESMDATFGRLGRIAGELERFCEEVGMKLPVTGFG